MDYVEKRVAGMEIAKELGEMEALEIQNWPEDYIEQCSAKALEMAVRNDDDGQRYSGLRERLRDLVRGDGVHPERSLESES